MSKLLLVPLEDAVVFPGMNITLTVDVGDEERVVLVPRHQSDYASVGTVADVVERVRLPGGVQAVVLSGLHRGVLGAADTSPDGELRVDVDEKPDETPPAVKTRELEVEYRAVVGEILELRGADERVSAFVRAVREPGALADTAGYSPDIAFEEKVELLEQVDVVERLRQAVKLQRERLAELQVRRRIREDVESGAQKQQREYFLRKQLDSIRKELGEDEASVVEEYRAKIEDAGMPDEVREQAERELARLERMGDSTGEASMIRTYLDWLLAVPWGKRSEERLDPAHAREVLDADHAGLEDAKERVVEYLAVRKLRQERGIAEDKRSGAILTLIGPPGTGKTSIGESIARALNREFVRMSLGGVRDEAEIRGHRRTYIGALPGRLVRALRDAGTMNPVIMLDEVDKVGADWRGDPSAALLEVLDPAQNHSFRDHYLDVELDLSEVVFIATANIPDTIPGPLLDRMEVIRFDGYTVDEKVAIARGYLWPRQRERNGLLEGEVEISDEMLETVVSDYTREAGVRQLERELGKLLRKTATKIASGEAQAPLVVDETVVRD
ncbi:MAG TPA: AAA family ATPase, partial [Gaiellaceae bacterium]|nr:AAA family ATPase [Gaiellaceae bacterium]